MTAATVQCHGSDEITVPLFLFVPSLALLTVGVRTIIHYGEARCSCSNDQNGISVMSSSWLGAFPYSASLRPLVESLRRSRGQRNPVRR